MRFHYIYECQVPLGEPEEKVAEIAGFELRNLLDADTSGMIVDADVRRTHPEVDRPSESEFYLVRFSLPEMLPLSVDEVKLLKDEGDVEWKSAYIIRAMEEVLKDSDAGTQESVMRCLTQELGSYSRSRLYDFLKEACSR